MSCEETIRCQAADNSDAEQVVQSISVSVKKSCFDEHGIDNLDELLKEIQEKQLQKKHVVKIENSGNSRHLEGCFCGIKAVREELQQILTKKMKEKQEQDEIRNKEKQLENEQTMLTETNEDKNISDKRLLAKRTHFIPIDKDVYDYLSLTYHEELAARCSSIEECETNSSFAIKIELNTNEDVETIKNDISALKSRFVVREHRVPEQINFHKFKDEVKATQKTNNAMTVFDSDQKTVKVIGSPKEADEIIQWILTLSASKHFDVKDEVVTKNAIETVNEHTYKHHDKRGATTEETKRDEKKTLIYDKSECSDRRGRPQDDSLGDDNKTLTDDTNPQHPDQQGTTKDDTKGDKKALIGDTNSEQRCENIKAKAETRGDDKKTLNDSNKSENSDTKDPTTDETKEDDRKTSTDDSKSYPDKDGTSKGDTMGYDKKTQLDDTKSEHQAKKLITKDEAERDDDKNTLSDNSKSKYPGKKGITNDDSKGDDDKALTDTTLEHPDIKGVGKHDIKKINTEDTRLGHNSTGVNGKEGNVKLDISEKGKADDKDKEMSLDTAAMKFSKTENKSEYDNESQGIQPPGAATTDNHTLQQPTKQRKLVHRISMDEDAYKYIQSFLQQELEDVTALCNSVQELRHEASNFYLGYTVKYEFEDETIRRRFQQLKDQVKVEEYKAPNMINASVLESLVHASAKSEGTMIFVQSEKNSLKIVGRPDKVDELKKRIEETVSEQLQSHEELSKENTHTYYPEQPRKQQSGAKYYHHIPIDKNLYTYISTHCQKEIERASKRCTSLTSSQKGLTFTIDFELQDMRDEEFVKRIFDKLMVQFKIEACGVPKGIDIAVIEEANTLREVMIFPQEDKQLLKLIGPQNQVLKTKKWIYSLISNTIQSEQPAAPKHHVANLTVHSSSLQDQPQSSKQSMLPVSTSLQKSNPVHSPRKPSERFKITSATSDILSYESKRVKNKLTVRVHFANIIKEKSDVLMSYDDEWLQGCTGLALAMKEAAGPDVERELADISKNRGPLEVGQVVHTSSGKLWPSVKYLAHAVSAKGNQYHPEDPKTFEYLYKTFLNCFNYTNNKICKNSISIPPIGLREYGVQLVSAAFSQAVEEYDAIAEATRPAITLRSIHFIDQDPAVVRQMITSIKSFIE